MRSGPEFQSPTGKVEVHVTCTGGTPSFPDEGVRTHEDEPEDPGRSSGATPASSGSSAPDDSDGRVGGGHGSDDGSSGRGGGSDD